MIFSDGIIDYFFSLVLCIFSFSHLPPPSFLFFIVKANSLYDDKLTRNPDLEELTVLWEGGTGKTEANSELREFSARMTSGQALSPDSDPIVPHAHPDCRTPGCAHHSESVPLAHPAL